MAQDGRSKRNPAELYFRGLPTGTDVRLLTDRFGVPPEGAEIDYSEIADLIGCAPGSVRFRTVTDAWRRKLEREHNSVLLPVGAAFKCADPHERVSHSGSRFRAGLRIALKAGSRAQATDRKRLSPEDQRAADHIVGMSASFRQAQSAAARELAYPVPEKRMLADVSGRKVR